MPETFEAKHRCRCPSPHCQHPVRPGDAVVFVDAHTTVQP